MKQALTFLFWLMISTKSLFGQPGDAGYSVVIYDESYGYVDCNSAKNTYQVFACKVEYLSNDFLKVAWIPNYSTLVVTDTLKCSTNSNTLFPYSTLFYGNSYLNANLILVIKNNRDTMIIDGAGEHLVSDYYGLGHQLPAVISFKKGFVKLFELQKEVEYRRLQNMSNQHFFIQQDPSQLAYNPWVRRISELNLNHSIVKEGDTLVLNVSGNITSDGSCSDGNLLWILQKKEGAIWKNYYEYLVQMDCGRGKNYFQNRFLPMFIVYNKTPKTAAYPRQITLISGTYRMVIFDDQSLAYFTEVFKF